MTTTETGDAFRDQVADLLVVAGYDVVVEILEGHKRIDIRFTDQNFGKKRTFALEAKNWSAPLNHDDLEKIYGGYASLLQRHDVDELLIVSRMPLKSPAAKAFIRDTPRVTHQSFLEFQESIMQCSGYLKEFLRVHAAEGLEEYYVNQFIQKVQKPHDRPSYDDTQRDEHESIVQTNASERLDIFVDNWIRQDSDEQLAIVASYGMGKTSFATHITYTMATRYLKGDDCRVPILLRLGSLSREQSVEGLLGSTLAGIGPNVRNYNYKLFDALSRAGRFLLILDGFDEMKHLMSRSEFRSAFDQLNRLCIGKAKVILMGRPSAFISDEERALFLSGRTRLDKQWLRMPGTPFYQELNLRRFNRDQTTEFISRFLSSSSVRARILVDKPSQSSVKFFINRRKREIESEIDADILDRPVHLRMLAEIACDPKIDIRGISRYGLYSFFVKRLIEREASKEGRLKSFSVEDRLMFAYDLAWYLWSNRTVTNGCRLEEVPNELFLGYSTGERSDIFAVKRDLLSASFLEEKDGGIFFIPHRSFLEFLVSEYIWDRAQPEFILQNGESITPEVLEFIADRDERTAVAEFFDSLAHYFDKRQGEISLDTIAAFCRMAEFYDAVVRLPTSSPWKVISYFVHLWLNSSLPNDEHEYRSLEADFIRKFTKFYTAPNDIVFSILYSLCGLQFQANQKLLARTIGNIVISNLWRASSPKRSRDLNQPMAEMLRAGFSVYTDQRGLMSLTLDLEEIFRFSRKQIRNICSIKEVNEGRLDLEHMQPRGFASGQAAKRQKITLPKGYFVYRSRTHLLNQMIEILQV